MGQSFTQHWNDMEYVSKVMASITLPKQQVQKFFTATNNLLIQKKSSCVK